MFWGAGELLLTRFFTRIAGRSPLVASLKAEFASRSEILESIQPQLRYLIDVNAHDRNKHRMWQQFQAKMAEILGRM